MRTCSGSKLFTQILSELEASGRPLYIIPTAVLSDKEITSLVSNPIMDHDMLSIIGEYDIKVKSFIKNPQIAEYLTLKMNTEVLPRRKRFYAKKGRIALVVRATHDITGLLGTELDDRDVRIWLVEYCEGEEESGFVESSGE